MSILISPPPFSILSTRRHVLVALSPQGTGAPKAGCLRVPSIICGNTTQRPPTVVLKPQRRHWNQFWPQQTDFSSLLRALLTPHSHSRALPLPLSPQPQSPSSFPSPLSPPNFVISVQVTSHPLSWITPAPLSGLGLNIFSSGDSDLNTLQTM